MRRTRRSGHSIQSGEWIITRTRHSGIEAETIEQYTLYRGGEEVSVYRSADKAKRAAKGERA